MGVRDRLSPLAKDRLRPYARVARRLRSRRPNIRELAYSTPTFSQFAEDLFLANHFADRLAGLQLDVGAYHPFAGSKTYLLHRRGWSGINVEPDPDAYDLFVRHRPGDVNLRLAVSSTPGSATFVRAGSIAGLDDDNWLWPGMEGERITVQTSTLAEILGDHVPRGQTVDLLDIDCEGHDLDALASNDWELYRPVLVLAEADDDEQAQAVRDFMRAHSYHQRTQIYLTLVSPPLRTSRSVGPTLAERSQANYAADVRVNVGQAKRDLSRLLARAEAGEEIEIARDGIPVARLVRIDSNPSPGERFLAARGSMTGRISIEVDFEFTDEEPDGLLDEPR